jgi:hypothetical protein
MVNRFLNRIQMERNLLFDFNSKERSMNVSNVFKVRKYLAGSKVILSPDKPYAQDTPWGVDLCTITEFGYFAN